MATSPVAFTMRMKCALGSPETYDGIWGRFLAAELDSLADP